MASNALTLTLCDPARESGTELLSLYGESARLVGNLLLRDDPLATFAPAGSSRRPFGLLAFAERRPPFVLSPGERFSISVTASPTAAGSLSDWCVALSDGTV